MANAIKTTYDSLPERITVPRQYVHKRAEVIILLEDDVAEPLPSLRDFFGSLPDFPDRGPQGAFEVRDEL